MLGWRGFIIPSMSRMTGTRRVDVLRDLVLDAVAPMALLDRDVRYVATSQRWMEL